MDQSHLHFRVSRTLKESFKRSCSQSGKSATQVLCELMHAYMEEQALFEKGYPEWFKANPLIQPPEDGG